MSVDKEDIRAVASIAGLTEEFEQSTNWYYLAPKFVKANPLYYDKNRMWWAWDKKTFSWVRCDETDIYISFDKVTKNTTTIKNSTKNEIIEAIKREARKNKPAELPNGCVQFQNKIYNLATKEEFDATPKYFNHNPIPWKVGAKSDTPKLDELFKSWVKPEDVPALYELIAFCCFNSYFLARCFALIGTGSNGKTVFMKIIVRFLGEYNVATIDFHKLLTSRFESAKLYRKLASFSSESKYHDITDTAQFKQLTGGDLMSFEFKFTQGFDAYNYAVLIMSTNSLPDTSDKTDAFYRRWRIFEFNNQFTEEKDVFAEIPPEEYEALARKVLEIGSRLWKERTFTNEGSLEERKAQYERLSDAIEQLIKERYEVNPDAYVKCYVFQNELKDFCKQNGYRELSQHEVGRKMIKNKGFERKQKRFVDEDGETKKVWCYLGLKEKDVNDNVTIKERNNNEKQNCHHLHHLHHQTTIKSLYRGVVEKSGETGDTGDTAKNTFKPLPENNDIITGDVSFSELIREFLAQYKHEGATISDISAYSEESDEKTEKYLENMRDKGEVYEKKGVWFLI